MRSAKDSNGRLANVFVQRYEDERVEVATAAWAEQRVLDGGQTQLVVLHDGERVEGVPRPGRFSAHPLRRARNSGRRS